MNASRAERSARAPTNCSWAGVEDGQEFFEEETTEEPRENPNGQKEAGSAGDPAQTVQREASSRGDHVNVRMMRQRRTPRMENGYGADASAQVFGISGDRDQRFGRRFEQDVVDRRLVVIGDVGDGRRQREHEVIIGNGQQFGFPLGEPDSGRRALTLRAMAVATGNGRRPLPVLWAKSAMGSQ